MYLNSNRIDELSRARAHWFKRLGVAGFLFFLLKGMLWLLLPWLAHSALF